MTTQTHGENQADPSPAALEQLNGSAQQVARGNYEAARDIFALTASRAQVPEIRDLAETMGLMCVKIEAREFGLEQALNDLKKEHEKLDQSCRLRAESGLLFGLIIFFLCLYMTGLYWMLNAGMLHSVGKSIFMSAINLTILAFSVFFIRRYRYPWGDWGFSLANSKRALVECLVVAIPVIAAGILVKWSLTANPGSLHFSNPVFEPLDPAWIIIYFPIAALQEIIARGFIQTSIARILPARHAATMAILLSSMLFAITHLFYSILTMGVTFLASLGLGWLFHRQKTLAGVVLLHYLLGLFYIFILKLIGW